jgi:hypothetical protein
MGDGPVDELRDAINRSIRGRIARGSSREAKLVNEALHVIGMAPKGLSTGRADRRAAPCQVRSDRYSSVNHMSLPEQVATQQADTAAKAGEELQKLQAEAAASVLRAGAVAATLSLAAGRRGRARSPCWRCGRSR